MLFGRAPGRAAEGARVRSKTAAMIMQSMSATPGTVSAHTLVTSLRRTMDEALGRALGSAKEVALVGYPNHENCGDSAIWTGEQAWMRAHGVRVAYASDAESFSANVLARRLGDPTILLHGGGNLGDVWPDHQSFREHVIAAYPRHHIVQMPQTIHFRTAESLKRAQSVFDAHPDLTLLVRDERSLRFARAHFRAVSYLCPDAAVALGSLERRAPERRLVRLARTDAEAAGDPASRLDREVRPEDWPLPRASGALYPKLRVASHRLGTALRRWPWAHPVLQPPLDRLYEWLARERTGAGCRALSAGRAVITDRLHAHILCVLLGIPHVLLDNNYGKLRSFYDTWTRECELTRWADSPDAAIDLAESLIPQ